MTSKAILTHRDLWCDSIITSDVGTVEAILGRDAVRFNSQSSRALGILKPEAAR